jgi:serine/threonine-protein phosphatase 5
LTFIHKLYVSSNQFSIKFFNILECKPDEPAYYTNRAIANLKVDKYMDAMADCKAALRIDPRFAKAYNRMSKCHIQLGQLTDASITL